jgi:hypothetical protein
MSCDGGGELPQIDADISRRIPSRHPRRTTRRNPVDIDTRADAGCWI